MVIQTDLVRQYAGALAELCGTSSNMVQAAVLSRAEELLHKGVTGDRLKDELCRYAIEAMGDACKITGAAASQVSAALYDEIMAAEGVPAEAAEIIDSPDLDALGRAARYQAYRADGPVHVWSIEGYAIQCGAAAGYQTRQMANYTMFNNVGRYYFDDQARNARNDLHQNYITTTSGYKRRQEYNAKRRADGVSDYDLTHDIRYARVPTGAETCTYCMMLASRGCVYHNEERAGHASHRGCNCVIIPGIRNSTTIAGYDTDDLMGLWQDYKTIDETRFTDNDGNPLYGNDLTAARNEAKRQARNARMGRDEFDDISGYKKGGDYHPEAGHVWERGKNVQQLAGLTDAQREKAEKQVQEMTPPRGADGQPLRGAALNQWRNGQRQDILAALAA